MWVLGVSAALAILVTRPAAILTPLAAPAPHGYAIQVSAVVERPAVASVLVTRPAQTAVARAGQTVEQLAKQYGGDVSAIRWANALGPNAEPTAGASVLIPPGKGALVHVRSGETPTAFAKRLGLDARIVLDYNALSSDAQLPDDTYLQVPLQQAPVGALISERFVVATRGVPAVLASRGSDTFPYGQCTWYVASRRNVTWGGNAINWWWSAARIRPEGHVAVRGAIVVFRIGWVGHVGYVESVNADGSFVISEMNYWYAGSGGWGRVDHRPVAAADQSVLGFIY
ncbi:MAG: CHAP domain-containing protein [Chloroflexi bacterium]|nr:MAG: CHAP domain-containing protein [Chloroflexota bacterium]